MILFGKSYYYSKENKIVFPMVIEEGRIVCSDKQGRSIVVLDQKFLTLMAPAKKGVVTPNFIKPKTNTTLVPVITKDTAAADKARDPTPDISVITSASDSPIIEPKTIEPVVITKNDEPELANTRTVFIPPADTSILKKKLKVIVTEDEYI